MEPSRYAELSWPDTSKPLTAFQALTALTEAPGCAPPPTTPQSQTRAEKKPQKVMLTKEEDVSGTTGHSNSVMVLPEVTISSPRTKRDRFASKSRRAGYLTAKAFWVTHYLAMVELTMVWGQSMAPAGLCCSLGKRDRKSCCSYSKPIPLPILFPENNTPLDIWEMKEQQNSVIPPNRGSMF